MGSSHAFYSFLLLLLIGTVVIIPSSSNELYAEVKRMRKLRDSLPSPPPPPISNDMEADYSPPKQPRAATDFVHVHD
ncbi:hypothetical protein TIFTF001_015554 [Ficus carica]|uniref:Transmembrane protein n=1 Tax=Ficus carica TaxID=3494 RepID=A0AA88ALP8_FICCA|nr:hypothetical protein TIFTF001_015554 [Ficus carica]